MFDSDRESTTTERLLGRRTVLKGAIGAGLLGVPASASAGDRHEITFTSTSEEVFEYRFDVSGDVERGGTYQSDDGDAVGESGVRGRCAGGRSDSFLFTGELVDLEVSGPGTVRVDGEVVLDRAEDARDEGRVRAVTFRAAEDEPTMRYEFSASGAVERGQDTDDGDTVSGNVVRGAVGSGRIDSFSFVGALETMTVDGRGTVSVDAAEDATGDDDLPLEIVVSSPGTDDLLEYAFEVTGEVVELEPHEDGPPATDEVRELGDGARVEGALTTGDDRFAYTGDLHLVDVPPEVNVEIRDR
ncbi:MAG: hypothetical protein ACOC2A_03835 [Halanaeroarchaeum sp.]